MCGSASDRTRAMSWGETFIECIFRTAGRAPRRRIAAPFSACSGKLGTGFAKSTRASSGNLERGGGGSALRACALHAARPRGYGALCGAALPKQPRDRRAQLTDAGVGARGGQHHLGIGGWVLGGRPPGRGDQAREVGILHLVGLGQHDLVVDRRLVEGLEHGVVDGLEAVAGGGEKKKPRGGGWPQQKG